MTLQGRGENKIKFCSLTLGLVQKLILKIITVCTIISSICRGFVLITVKQFKRDKIKKKTTMLFNMQEHDCILY